MAKQSIKFRLEWAEQALEQLSPRACERGVQYYRRGLVRNIVFDDSQGLYRGEVVANHLYFVCLRMAPNNSESACTCPDSFGCEHAAAMLYALMDRYRAGDLPGAEAEAATSGSGLVKAVEESLDRSLKADERRFLRGVVDLFGKCRWRMAVEGWQLAPLGFQMPNSMAYSVLELGPDPIQDELQFWLHLACACEEKGITWPAFMKGVTKLDEVRAALADWKRKREITLWRNMLIQSVQSVESLGPMNVDFRLMLKPDGPVFQWRQEGEAKFRHLRQTDLRRLREAFNEGRLRMHADAFVLWTTCVHHGTYETRVAVSEADTNSAVRVGELLRRPELNERIVNSAGAPFRRLTEPLAWKLIEAEDQDQDYRVSLVSSNGSTAPDYFLYLPGEPALYVSQDAVHPGPPMNPVLDPRKIVSIPAPALESEAGLQVLRQIGVALPPRLESRVRTVRMVVTLSCAVQEAYPGSSTDYLFVKATASPEGGDAVERLTDAGWVQETNSTRSKKKKGGGDQFVVHDRSDLEKASALLAPLGVKWDAYPSSWRLKVTKNFPESFSTWVSAVPPRIKLVLDEQLQSLAGDPISGTLRLECTEAGVDWFDLRVLVDVTDTTLTPAELKMLLDAKGGFVHLGKKGWRRLKFNLDAEQDQKLARIGLSPQDLTSEPQRLHALQLADSATSHFLPEAQVVDIRRRADEIKTRVNPSVPATVRAELRPYQVEGFHFLAYLSENHFGGVLADDMGLGKTLQTLTWIAWLREKPANAKRKSLVVCPKSVMDNWRGEAERFLPGLRVWLWRGTTTVDLASKLAECDLLVLNYSQFRSLSAEMDKITWLTAVLDEGQYIKNPESQAAKASRALKADHRLVLSGTPIENKLLDLWSLMSFAMPGILGQRAYFTKLFDKTTDPLARRRLAARVRPFLLRRTKQEVASELPDRIEEDIHCEIEEEQKTLYRAELKRAQMLLLGINSVQELNEKRFHFLTSLLRLRQICCHPALVDATMADKESAKLNALLDLLEPLMEEGNKVLVFSQFVSMLDLIQRKVVEREWPHFFLAGDTEDRGELVKEFQATEGAAVFLISLKAGGFGLNLTAASYVVLFDPWWNPAVENQAIDRTHRIGQTSKVIAYRLLIKDSIEDKIRALQKTKSALAQDVLGEEGFGGSLSIDDLKFLFSDESM